MKKTYSFPLVRQPPPPPPRTRPPDSWEPLLAPAVRPSEPGALPCRLLARAHQSRSPYPASDAASTRPAAGISLHRAVCHLHHSARPASIVIRRYHAGVSLHRPGSSLFPVLAKSLSMQNFSPPPPPPRSTRVRVSARRAEPPHDHASTRGPLPLPLAPNR
uniref:Uncharacterized protein n=1 Tax=Oryza punctata TaxID=4537 RepID=A0A0E0LEZ8_ORYPU